MAMTPHRWPAQTALQPAARHPVQGVAWPPAQLSTISSTARRVLFAICLLISSDTDFASMGIVGFDDQLHKTMTDNIAVGKFDKLDPFNATHDVLCFDQS